ncbi:hypothetical protein B0H66DRAFT_567786 [Apodospora peruviana]|uniref:PROCN domain-containing protein n=1 Tax=Apodospora peruviana TaxID=516989 RepID=A0AAE0HWG2_9PEZI|nr:hypothetical protein B0H66DRAFT_567786 [Apodospora peruviana]
MFFTSSIKGSPRPYLQRQNHIRTLKQPKFFQQTTMDWVKAGLQVCRQDFNMLKFYPRRTQTRLATIGSIARAYLVGSGLGDETRREGRTGTARSWKKVLLPFHVLCRPRLCPRR